MWDLDKHDGKTSFLGNQKLIIAYCNQDPPSEELTYYTMAAGSRKGPSGSPANVTPQSWEGPASSQSGGSGPAHLTAADWTRAKPIKFLLPSIWK